MIAALAVPLLGAAGCSDFFLQGRDEPDDPPLRVEESWEQAALPAVDVLWVVDDTPSMADELVALADAADAFVAALDAAELSWQVGVVTTDLTAADAGRLQGNPWVIVPGLADPVGALADAAQVSADGAEPAGGLGAAALALTAPLKSGDNRGFRRPDAALHVVVFSDGEDESDRVLGDDPVAAFTDHMAAEAAETGRSALMSAVVGDARTGCVGELGVAVPGERYLAAAAATGGASASICAANLGPVLEQVGAISAEWPTRFPLQAVPETGTERVWLDGARQLDGWSIDRDAPALVFEVAPEPDAAVRMSYVVGATAGRDTGVAP